MSSEAVARRGELYVISAPSGAGKTTLIRSLLAGDPPLGGEVAFSVSHTTRPPRPGERHGVDYHFVQPPDFERLIAADRFLEWAEVYGHYKGTSRDEVEGRLAAGIDVILDIDVQGARQVRRRRPEARSIFVLPPSFGELEHRLRSRGHDTPQQVADRLAAARREMECAPSYDFVIINDDAGRARRALAAIFLAGRHRSERMQAQIERVLATFP